MKSLRRLLFSNNGVISVKNICRTYATLPKEALVARYKQHGNVVNAVKLETESLPSDLQPNQVLVKMLAAPINPADVNMIEGNYGKLADKLPAIGGNEGVGVVEQVGSAVTDIKVNQRVIPARAGFGTWRNYAVATTDDLIAVPDDIPVEYSAVLSVNPSTAYRLLNDFVKLQAGDVVVQNGANSAVGLSVIQLCKKRGIKTINIIRGPRPNQEELVESMKRLGGDIVVTEQFANSPAMRNLISDLPKAKLGLNSVGGDSVRTVARFLGDDAQLVTFGGMSRKAVSLPTGPFIFNNIVARGFWLTKWAEKASKEERSKMINELHQLVKNQELVLFLENRKFSDFSIALQSALEPFKQRKIVLKF